MNSDDESGSFGVRPILCVESVARSMQYYVESLGFRLGLTWSDKEGRFLPPGDRAEPTFALVGCGQVQFMLVQQCQGAPGMWLHLDIHMADCLVRGVDAARSANRRAAGPPPVGDV
jgi:hypothetical protein